MEIKTEKIEEGRLLLNTDFREILSCNGISSFGDLWNVPSEPVKKIVKQRGTERVVLRTPEGMRLEAYIKRYRPDPPLEKLKNLFSLRPARYPGALNEWNAVLEYHKNGLPTMTPVAYASDGRNSCILTLGIIDYTRASDLFAKFAGGERLRRRRIIRRIAELAAGMHSAGMAHQDFYLVHMFIREKEDDKIYLIDLQRTIFREDFSERWRIKDLAQLLFSARGLVSRTDVMCFWKEYCRMTGLRPDDSSIADRIISKAGSIARHAG